MINNYLKYYGSTPIFRITDLLTLNAGKRDKILEKHLSFVMLAAALHIFVSKSFTNRFLSQSTKNATLADTHL